MTPEGEWYWSLSQRRAVHVSERGPAEDVLGPYPTKEAAENWKELVEKRNEEWEEQDEEWEGREPDE